MKSIKNLIVLSLMVFLSTSTLIAQVGEKRGKAHNPEAHAQMKTERLAKQLNLTDQQKAEVTKINLAYAEKMKAAKAGATDREAAREAMKSLRAEHKTAIKSVLTAEQVAKMDAKKEKRAERPHPNAKHQKGQKHQKGGKHGKGMRSQKKVERSPQARAENRTEKMTEHLGLSKEQSDQIAKINATYADKIASQRKANAKDKEAAKTAIKSLKSEQASAIKSILTPEQMTKYEAMKKRRSRKGHTMDKRKRI